MEEILASIRRIISEDEEDAGAAAAPVAETPRPRSVRTAPEKSAAPVHAPQQAFDDADEEPADDDADDFSASADEDDEDDAAQERLATKDVEMIKKNVAAAVHDDVEENYVAETAASAASEAFRSLSRSVRVTDADGPGKTLEEIVVDMLRPMVKDWLDANLPGIVEEKVEEEVQRIARRR